MRSRRHRRKLAAAATVAVLGAALSACSSAGSSGGGSASGSGSVNIGLVGQFSGNLSSSFGGLPKVLDAWASAVNASGGLNGKHVNVVSEDTGAQADGAAIGKQLAQDNVSGVVEWGLGATNDNTWLTYLESKKIPVIMAAPPATAAALQDPLAFPVTGAGPTALYAFVATAKTLGPKLGVAYCSDDSACASVPALFKAVAGPIGVDMAATVEAPSTAPDYTTVCQAFKTNDVASYYLNFASAAAVRITNTCAQQGVTAAQLLTAGTASPGWKTDSSFTGDIVIDNSAPYFDTSIPAVAAYRAALGKYAPSIPGTALDNSAGLWMWAAGQLIKTAATRSAGTVTRASIINGLYSLKQDTLGGIVQPLTFIRSKPTWLPCWFNWKIAKAGQFQAVDNAKPTCAPQSVVNAVVSEVIKAS